jgi:glycine/D-amino acid oxidase-like deaminating enzyme
MNPQKRIAILGAGLAGLGVLAAARSHTDWEIDVYDPAGIAGGASGAAAGVLHPYAGARARLTWGAAEGMPEACALIEEVHAASGGSLLSHRGLLRLALNDRQRAAFQASAAAYQDVHWLSAEACHERLPAFTKTEGIFIDSALALDISSYLKALWQLCAREGIRLIQRRISTLQELDAYDAVVVALGAACTQLEGCGDLPLHPVKGQLLKLKWPETVAPLPCAVNSVGYLVQHAPGYCIAGATFEHVFDSPEPDRALAQQVILEKVLPLLPALEGAEVVDVYAGLRASAPGHRPFFQQLNPRTWVLAGLGSKGLLHHARFGRLVRESIQHAFAH